MNRSIAFMAFCLAFRASPEAQVEIFPKPWSNPALWSAETLWVGASFARTSPDPVTVSLKGNVAGWSGDLFFIDPRTGAEDRLFSNHDPVGTTVVLSDRHDIPIGDTLYFVYRVTEPVDGIYPSAASRLPKYTGPNIPGQSRYVATATNPKYGHRWAVAGRASDSIVEFGFEDDVEPASSDYDFDDIVFRTTLSLLGAEIPARLSFTDKGGGTLAPGASYSPANDTLYLAYADDFAGNTLRKEVAITIRNRRGAAAPDSETVAVLPLRREGSTGIWTAKLPLAEAGGVPGDGRAQVYYLGEITAQVRTHNRLGLADGGVATATLKAVYPDRPETLAIVPCADPALGVGRATPCIRLQAGDQSFTRGRDTVWADVRCGESGDAIERVALLEGAEGNYLSADIAKNEGAAPVPDAILTCKAGDAIIATYTDEIYGGKASDRIAWAGPPPLLATGAWIKDADGDGRGDRVYVSFSRAPDAPPAKVTPLYWNQRLDDALHAFNGAPKSIAFDPSRPNTVAIDLSDSPFPKGFTGIPAGAVPPVLTLPAGEPFAGQSPAIADSMGPILVKGEMRPFDGRNAGATTLDVDTLIATVSEPLAPRDWAGLIRVGASEDGICRDYDRAQVLVPAGPPEPGPDGLVFVFLIGNEGPRPRIGDCAWLTADGTVTDALANAAPVHGEPLGGRPPPRRIEDLRGYPPVAGLDPRGPASSSANGILRPAFGTTAPAPDGSPIWIAPADWPAGYVPGSTVYKPESHAPSERPQPGREPTHPGALPPGIGTVQVVSTGEYVAEVSIFDNLGNGVREFTQSFGYRGELSNPARRAGAGKGLVSYLVWDLKDARGRKAGNGAYIWKIRFRFPAGSQEIRYVLTGMTRGAGM